ncbi:amino acid permease [Pallidibacillus pasinlerensis]|uniref:Amino acid permease n=1 Tax=Pallidibacillus pasinlerensis TaxID=2703818 RepID=A0ABX0A3U9_9BACI|nr:amino acid permease [Pallidibacillus pasinlerensis]NCU17181.1 amino acid permease [Pallidibacillus pasinlerensis]
MKHAFSRKKNISDLLERKKRTRLPQTLSGFDLIMLGLGAIVGTGIFILPGTVAATHAGPAISISFLIAAFVCCLAGMCYAEFSSKIPVTGSAYTYAYITFGELIAWLVGWALVLEYGLAVASVATGWSAYFNGLLQGFNLSIPQALSGPFNPADGTYINFPAMAIILILAFLLTRGLRESANINRIMVFIKIGIILLFILIGVFYVEPANWQPFIPFGFEGILSGAAIVFFAFLGFDAVSSAAEEVKKPQRNLPIGIIGSLFVCALLYMAVSFVLTGIVPFTDLNVSNPVSYAMQLVNQGWISGVISIGAIVGMTTVMLVMIYAGARLLFALSRDGLLPKFLIELNKFQTPAKGTWTFAIIVAIFAGFIPLAQLAELVNMGTLIAFSMVSIGIIALRKNKNLPTDGFQVPLYPVLPIVSFLACLFLISQLSVTTWIASFIWFILGIILYFLYGKNNSILN